MREKVTKGTHTCLIKGLFGHKFVYSKKFILNSECFQYIFTTYSERWLFVLWVIGHQPPIRQSTNGCSRRFCVKINLETDLFNI